MSSRARARLGLLVPFTNTNLEPDFALMAPPDVTVHVARLGGYDEDEIPDETQMQGLGDADIDEPLRLLMGVRPDVVIYGCTSATLTHGPAFDRDLAARIERDCGAKTVTAAGALVHALKVLGTDKIGFASPYVPTINDMAIRFLDAMDITTVARSEVEDTLSNEGQGALDPAAVHALGLAADGPDVEAIVLSCTDMRSVEVIETLERETGKPVISSNQAMLSQTLELLGAPTRIQGFGRLLESRSE